MAFLRLPVCGVISTTAARTVALARTSAVKKMRLLRALSFEPKGERIHTRVLSWRES